MSLPTVRQSVLKRLVIIYHSKTGNTRAMIDAVIDGAKDPQLNDVDVHVLTAAEAQPEDLLSADGLILGTPENFGYMSGALKDFFDRSFYEVEGRLPPLPYATVINAGNDGSGAIRSIERIANGYPLVQVQEAIIGHGPPDQETLDRCKELGGALAAGLELGVY
ncbi:MAG: flavodoxin [Gammaproteobacteria bacterium]|nr:flavodoxin [Gammaproteobacteria bacterium]